MWGLGPQSRAGVEETLTRFFCAQRALPAPEADHRPIGRVPGDFLPPRALFRPVARDYTLGPWVPAEKSRVG